MAIGWVKDDMGDPFWVLARSGDIAASPLVNGQMTMGVT
jgi:hypothetical protein